MNAPGIDIGTTTISIVLLNEENGELIARETIGHGAFIDDGCPVGKAQDPEKIWRIVKGCIDVLLEEHGDPACIGITGQMHGMLYELLQSYEEICRRIGRRPGRMVGSGNG